MEINCEACRIGHFQPVHAPYLQRIGSEMLIISDAPAYNCDICGKLIYDAEFMSQLDFLLEHRSGEVRDGKIARQQMLSEEWVDWQSSRRSR